MPVETNQKLGRWEQIKKILDYVSVGLIAVGAFIGLPLLIEMGIGDLAVTNPLVDEGVKKGKEWREKVRNLFSFKGPDTKMQGGVKLPAPAG